MQTINVQSVPSTASSMVSVCWPEYVEDSFEKLLADLRLIAELPVADTDILRIPTHAI